MDGTWDTAGAKHVKLCLISKTYKTLIVYSIIYVLTYQSPLAEYMSKTDSSGGADVYPVSWGTPNTPQAQGSLGYLPEFEKHSHM